MQSCTECGAPISPKIGPPVLLNGTVVCQPCWQKSDQNGAAAAPPPSRSTSGSARAGAVSRRTTGAPAPAASSSRRQTSATPAARRSSSRTEAPRKDALREDSAPRATSRTATLIEQVESSTSSEKLKMYMIVVMCVMVLGAAIAGWIWYSKTTRDKEEAARAQNEANTAWAGIQDIVKRSPDDYAAIKTRITEAKEKLKEFPLLKNQADNALAETVNRENTAQTKKANDQLLADLKRDIDDPAKRGTVKIAIDQARIAANSMGKEYLEDVNKINDKLTANTLNDFVVQAKAKEASGDLPGALAAYDEAVTKFNKEFDKAGGKAAPELLEMYKGLLIESDKLVERVETPEYEASIPERDLLSPKERNLWGKSEGVDYTFQARELEMRGVEVPGKKVTGFVDFGLVPSAPWHDLIVNLNFTIVSGEIELWTRYWPGKRAFSIKMNPESGFELNKPHDITLRIKGSKIEFLVPDQAPKVDTFSVNTSRTGGIAFSLNPGSKVIISTCKVKLLRPRS